MDTERNQWRDHHSWLPVRDRSTSRALGLIQTTYIDRSSLPPVRWAVTPGKRAMESATEVSGSRPMSSEDIDSIMVPALRLLSIAFSRLERKPVTTTSSRSSESDADAAVGSKDTVKTDKPSERKRPFTLEVPKTVNVPINRSNVLFLMFPPTFYFLMLEFYVQPVAPRSSCIRIHSARKITTMS